MENFIIHIIRSPQAWPATSFFKRSLKWNLKENQNEVDFPEIFNGKDGKPMLLITTKDKEVELWCLMNDIKCRAPKASDKENRILAFWNGIAYKSLPKHWQTEDDEAIMKLINDSPKDCQVINRYPSEAFRAGKKIQEMLKQGIIPTVEHFQKEYRKNTKLAEDIREKVTWRDDPPAIDPDTDMPYTKEDNEANKQLLNSYDFNANLAMACASKLSSQS